MMLLLTVVVVGVIQREKYKNGCSTINAEFFPLNVHGHSLFSCAACIAVILCVWHGDDIGIDRG